MSTTDRHARMRALELANQIRTSRAAVKRSLALGQSPAPLIADPPEHLATMTISALLSALRGYGPRRVTRTLHAAHVSPMTRLGALTDRQRAALIAATDHL